MWKFKPKYPQSYWWERRQLGQQESREAEEMDENGNYWRVWNHKHERRKKKKQEEDLRPRKLETNTEDKQIKFLGWQ